MTRRARRIQNAAETTSLRVKIERLSIETSSVHVGHRIAESLISTMESELLHPDSGLSPDSMVETIDPVPVTNGMSPEQTGLVLGQALARQLMS